MTIASLMALDMTGGALDGSTLLNGTALGSSGQDFDFTLHAVFDSTPIGPSSTSFAWFATTTTMTLTTLSGDVTLRGTVPVVLAAIHFGPLVMYAAGIAPDGVSDNYILGTAQSPVFDPLNPTPMVLVSDTTIATGTLVFGTDTLSNLVGGTKVLTVEVSNATAVPEPSTYALLCISLGVVGFVRKKMIKVEG